MSDRWVPLAELCACAALGPEELARFRAEVSPADVLDLIQRARRVEEDGEALARISESSRLLLHAIRGQADGLGEWKDLITANAELGMLLVGHLMARHDLERECEDLRQQVRHWRAMVHAEEP